MDLKYVVFEVVGYIFVLFCAHGDEDEDVLHHVVG
jgi:hypothetical protein